MRLFKIIFAACLIKLKVKFTMLSKKVLIINENCSDNIGDHAINEGVKN